MKEVKKDFNLIFLPNLATYITRIITLNPYKKYIISFVGLSFDTHIYNYLIDQRFFDLYEYSIVKNGEISVNLELKKQENLMHLRFRSEGTIDLSCDKCLGLYPYFIKTEDQLIVKFIDGETNDEGDILYLNKNEHELNVAPFIYDFINLKAPYTSPCDGTHSYCDNLVLEKLKALTIQNQEKEPYDERWEVLKNIKPRK